MRWKKAPGYGIMLLSYRNGEMCMLPKAFLDRMQLQLGEEYPQFLQTLERPRAVALRFNALCPGAGTLGGSGGLL